MTDYTVKKGGAGGSGGGGDNVHLSSVDRTLLEGLETFLMDKFAPHIRSGGGVGGGDDGGDGKKSSSGGSGTADRLNEITRTKQLVNAQEGWAETIERNREEMAKQRERLKKGEISDRVFRLRQEKADREKAQSFRNTIGGMIDVTNIWSSAYEQGMMAFVRELAGARQALINYVASLMDGSEFRRRWERSWGAVSDASQRGIGDFFTYIRSWGSLGRAIEILTSGIENNTSAFTTFRGTFREYNDAMIRARGVMTDEFGSTIYGQLNGVQVMRLLESTNAMMARAGNRTEIDSRENAQAAQRMYEIYRDIAANTGMTVEQLIEMNRTTGVDVANRIRAAGLDEQQRQNFMETVGSLQALVSQGYLDQSVVDAFITRLNDPTALFGLDIPSGLMEAMMDAYAQTEAGNGLSMAELQRILVRYSAGREGLPMGDSALAQGRMAASGSATVNRRPVSAWLNEMWNQFMAFIGDRAEIVRDIIAIGAGAAMALHTAAMLIHSAALTKFLGFFPLMRRLLGGIARFAGFGGAAAGGAGAAAGGAGAGEMLARFAANPLVKAGAVVGGIYLAFEAIRGIYQAFNTTSEDMQDLRDGISEQGVGFGAMMRNLFPTIAAGIGIAIAAIAAAIFGAPIAIAVAAGAAITGLIIWIDNMTGNAISNWVGRTSRDVARFVIEKWNQFTDYMGNIMNMIGTAFAALLDAHLNLFIDSYNSIPFAPDIPRANFSGRQDVRVPAMELSDEERESLIGDGRETDVSLQERIIDLLDGIFGSTRDSVRLAEEGNHERRMGNSLAGRGRFSSN